MRDLSSDHSLLSINSMTVKRWSLKQLLEGCVRAGIGAISPWRDIVQGCGVAQAGKLIRAHGVTVTGLCRGGMFPAADEPAHPLREYGVGAQILKDLGVRRMILMSNTRPNVLPGLDGYGLTVEGWRKIDGE